MDFTRKRIVGLLRQSSDQQASLDEQETLFKAFVNQHNLTIINQWRVIGSAMEDDPEQFYKDMRSNGVTAYDDLRDLWAVHGFDILWALEPTRIGRAKWLYNNIIERTASSGASIYLHKGGVIDAQNVDTMVAITSIGSKSDVDRLHDERAQKTFKDKADNGIPPYSRVPWTHMLIRDDKGNPLKVEIDPSALPIINHATEHLLKGDSYRNIATTMESIGIDKLTSSDAVRRLFFSPFAHGHTAYRHRHQYGAWCLEDGHPIPDGIHIAYDVVPALWTGEQHQYVIDELKNRLTANRGRYNRHTSLNPFARLIRCADCGYALKINKRKAHRYLRCETRWKRGTECPNQTYVKLEYMIAWFDAQLRGGLEDGILSLTIPEYNRLEAWQHEIRQHESQLADINRVLGKLILDRAKSPDIITIYDDQIKKQTAQLQLIESQLKRLKRSRPVDTQIQVKAIENLRAMTVDTLWTLPAGEVNAILHRLMGQSRIYMHGYNIVDIR